MSYWNPYFDSSIQDRLNLTKYQGQYNQSLRRGLPMYEGQYNQNLNRTSFYKPDLNNPQGVSPSNSINGASAFTGIIGLGLNASAAANRGLNLNQQIAPSQFDYNSAPTYTAGNAQSEAYNAKIEGVNSGEVASGAAQGAAIGTQILPGVGTAVGIVLGAGSAIIAGNSREAKQRRERNFALNRVNLAQQQYNQQDVNFRRNQNQYNEYLQRQNPYAREYNVYKSRFNY